MKKLFTLLMALSMMLTLFTGCANTAAPADPAPAPESSSVPEPEPEPESTVVEGVVKEVSLGKIIVTLADGTNFALNTAGIADLKVNLGDEVKVEYTGAPGSAVAGKVKVTKAAPVEETVTGVVKETTASMILLTLGDETELVLLTKDVEGLEALEIKVGDKITATYTMGDAGAVASAVEVVEAATPEDAPSDAGASSQSSAPVTPASSSSPASTAPAPQQGGSTGGGNGNQLKSYVDWIKSIGTPEDGGDNSGDNSSGGNSSSRNEDNQDQPEEDPVETSKSESKPDPEPEPESEPSKEAGDVYEAIRLINAERTKAGLAELTIDDDLMSMAAVRAEEMSEKFEHVRPDGSDWKTIFDDFGWTWPNKRGENGSAGDGSASKTVLRWMNSSGHKANILKDNVTQIGVGYHYDGSTKWKHFWTMIVTN